jgi:signal transduction histidine kinase
MEAQIASGTIEVRVFTDPLDGVSFEVIDDGIGVSESARAHLFDPFYSSREAGRGLGFGLSKAWRIAELHGGSLTFDPEHSPGARFVLRIPFQQR